MKTKIVIYYTFKMLLICNVLIRSQTGIRRTGQNSARKINLIYILILVLKGLQERSCAWPRIQNRIQILGSQPASVVPSSWPFISTRTCTVAVSLLSISCTSESPRSAADCEPKPFVIPVLWTLSNSCMPSEPCRLLSGTRRFSTGDSVK